MSGVAISMGAQIGREYKWRLWEVTEMTARLADICKQIFKFESLLVSRVSVEKGVLSMTSALQLFTPSKK